MTRYLIKRIESCCLHLSMYGNLEIPWESQDLATKRDLTDLTKINFLQLPLVEKIPLLGSIAIITSLILRYQLLLVYLHYEMP